MNWVKNPDILAQAIDICLTGGNHLVAPLQRKLGVDFPEKYPPTADYWKTLEEIGEGATFDVWVCWAAIMRARDLATIKD